MKNRYLKNKLAGLLAILIVVASFAGCLDGDDDDKDDDKDNGYDYADSSYVVSAEWLNNNTERDDVLIVDARGQAAYDEGHIPGAIPVAWQEFANMAPAAGEAGFGVLLPASNLSTLLAEKGFDTDKTIVVYANNPNGWGEDGRIVWMLRMVGLEKSGMLDGGYDNWNGSGYDISTESTEPVASDFTVTGLDLSYTISTTGLNDTLDSVKIIDTRTLEEYDGATNYGEARGGHLPGAISLPFVELLNADGTFKNQLELETVFGAATISKDDTIITYCTAGIRSAHMALVLRMAGYQNSMNYDASFYEWAGNDNLTVEQ